MTGGLLVRQNYTEDNIGQAKAWALAARLKAIRDDLKVHIADGAAAGHKASLLAADLIVDATVSLSVTTYLDSISANPDRRALMAQVATDTSSGTLGVLNICAMGSQPSLSDVDRLAGQSVVADPRLELYHPFWGDVAEGDELIPTRGCSVPTFHGSAADLAAVAATLTSLIGTHLQLSAPLSGTTLVALPHAADGPRYCYLPTLTRDTSEPESQSL